MRAASREFFALPSAAKLEYYIGRSKNHRGYVPPGEEVFYSQTKDTKEAFDLSRDLPDVDYGRASRLQVRTSPGPTAGMGGELRVRPQRDSTLRGPIPISGP